MKNKIKPRSDYDKIKNNLIEQLKTIKEHALNYQENRYAMSIILDAMRMLMNTEQKEGESLQDYTSHCVLLELSSSPMSADRSYSPRLLRRCQCLTRPMRRSWRSFKDRFTINSVSICTWITRTNPSLVPYWLDSTRNSPAIHRLYL